MRYQSFYPFSNQPPQPRMTPATPPIQQRAPMPFPQQGMGNSRNPREMRGGAPQQQAGMQETGPSRADQYMQTANRFFNTAQQFAPLVQQFAPLVQNLPAMWRLYKGVQSMPDAPTASSAPRPSSPQTPNSRPSQATNQPSIPRIFQPPF
ncbi:MULTISPECIES: VrrA/YqfQ family protein [unclassified Sporosarcina]|uniref:VrrA/YqfQ family protein n=1 Tax=unclassified Sporosarcina TaxID=2647733 RepID=UPI000C16F7C4|nr:MULTISPECIES: VrrA/YqfQ family protein [unclassified Sporosarcina]PID00443.1 hypothetical protein CSV68_02640 [Sporosarcina sp. P29]PID05732.1 hypothetical protein CSV66_08100 [Sporosarcina sp. P30]PID08926.1 hypothetical protein CSV65_08100 [Sporosarcina sp. P31]PID12012.1 hypothetical protein CSV64_08645 [Sporosarcina sp. P32b]